MSDPEAIQMKAQIQQLAKLVGQLRGDLDSARGAVLAQSCWLHALLSAVPNAHDAGRAAGERRAELLHGLANNVSAIRAFQQVDEAMQRTVNKVGK